MTGKCVCQHNTTGDNCDKCKDGFYGNPTEGKEDDCKPCPCKFGSSCIQIGKDVVCTDCPEGHEGNLCEYCSDGYFGDLSGEEGTTCQKCNCSGNIHENAIGNCNSLTGDCIKCIYNSRNGPLNRCELCAMGFYGNATLYPKPQCKGVYIFVLQNISFRIYSMTVEVQISVFFMDLCRTGLNTN